MKINSFYDKVPPEKSNRLKITASGVQNVVDTSKITRLELELENLKQKLELSEGTLSVATTQHLKEKEQFSISKRKNKELNDEINKLRAEYNLVVTDVSKLQGDYSKSKEILEDLLKQKNKFTSISQEHETLQYDFGKIKEDLELFTAKSALLVATKDLLEGKVRDLEGSNQADRIDLENFKDKYNTMRDTLTKAQENTMDLRKRLNEAHRNIQTWKNGFDTLEEENSNLIGIKANLTTWLEQIQGETSELTGKSTLQNKELYKAKQTITELGKTVDDLISTNSYLRERNNTYINELNKPRYASIGAISRQEGFRFPTQFIAPKNSLGTGKPTLLKVRKP